ncbi:MAG: PAS domain S-box protein [Nitrospirae bacterium]|nr:MAG: PAS domain S-box protein [Nitrospirota bacterium]
MSLKRDFYVRMSLILTLSAIIIISVVIRKQRELLLEDMRDKGESIARVLSTVTMDSMLTYDYGTMERYVRQVAENKDIVFLKIIRSDGEVLAEAKGTNNNKNIFLSVYPIAVGGSTLGSVEVSFSMERVDAISRKIIISAIAFILIVHAIGLAVNNAIVNSLVLRPISALIETTRRIKEGGLKDSTASGSRGEFGELATAFNDMAASLDRNFEALERSGKEVQTAKNKLEAIVQSLADGLFVSNSDGLIVSFNRAAEDISGYTEHEALGLHCEEVFKTRLCADACALHNEDKTIRNKETGIITKDGRRRLVSVSSAIIRDSDGKSIGGVQTFRDITDEKQRQVMLCQSEKLAAIGQMSAGLAHEINNPLGNILGYARLLLKDDALTSGQREKIGIIAEQAKKGSGVVQGLLDYSRQSGAVREAVAVNRVIEDIIRLLQPQAEKSGTKIIPALGELPDIHADPKQIEQVIFNLAMNAMHAIGRDGTIRIETANTAAGKVEIRVNDTGTGIPEEIQGRIFDPFFTTKPVGKGTGLGLSVCLGIIKDHGGSIDVESSIGEGATFIVRLPAGEERHG